MPKQVRYIEEFPDKIDRIFNDIDEYHNFIASRVNEITIKLDIFNNSSKYRYSDWKHQTITLNKDGRPRKYNPAHHLQTKEARERQLTKYREYLRELRNNTKEKKIAEQKANEKAYADAIRILNKNNIDINRLDIRIRKR